MTWQRERIVAGCRAGAWQEKLSVKLARTQEAWTLTAMVLEARQCVMAEWQSRKKLLSCKKSKMSITDAPSCLPLLVHKLKLVKWKNEAHILTISY